MASFKDSNGYLWAPGMRLIKIWIALVASIHGFIASAQTDTKSLSLWADAVVKYDFNPNWRVGGDFGPRLNLDNDLLTLYIRPGVTWHPSSIYGANLSVALFQASSSPRNHRTEFRIHQEFTVNWPQFVGYRIQHRIRIEEQFFYEESGNSQDVRGRYQFQFEPPDIDLFSIPFYANISWEGFVPFTEQTNQPLQNQRWTIRLGGRLSTKFTIEVNYLWQLRRDEQQHDSFIVNENVWRFRLNYLLNP